MRFRRKVKKDLFTEVERIVNKTVIHHQMAVEHTVKHLPIPKPESLTIHFVGYDGRPYLITVPYSSGYKSPTYQVPGHLISNEIGLIGPQFYLEWNR